MLKEIDRFISNELSMILKRPFNQEQNVLQSKKTKLQEITIQEEKEKEYQLSLKEQLEKTKQKIEKLSKDVETLVDFDQERISSSRK